MLAYKFPVLRSTLYPYYMFVKYGGELCTAKW